MWTTLHFLGAFMRHPSVPVPLMKNCLQMKYVVRSEESDIDETTSSHCTIA